jgi:hypothetical protein
VCLAGTFQLTNALAERGHLGAFADFLGASELDLLHALGELERALGLAGVLDDGRDLQRRKESGGGNEKMNGNTRKK